MNQLNVSLQHSITTLAAHGWSHRRIARELDINRETVGKYLRLVNSKPAISTPGSESDPAPEPASAVCADGGGARSRSAGGFWPGRLGDGGRQAEAAPSVSDRSEPFAQRLQ